MPRNLHQLNKLLLQQDILLSYRGVMVLGGALVYLWGYIFSQKFALNIPFYIPIGLMCWIGSIISSFTNSRQRNGLIYTIVCSIAIAHQFYLLTINHFHIYLILSFNLAIIITTVPLYSLLVVSLFSASTMFFGIWHFFQSQNPNAALFLLSSSSFILVIFYITWSKLNYIKQIRLAQSQSISSAKMAALGEMASGIAHEINNPLTIIGASLSVIEKQLNHTPVEDSKIINSLEKIKRTHERITKIVRGLNAFSGNSEREEQQNISLVLVLEDTLSLIEPRINEHNILLNFKKSDWNINMKIYPVQLSQVLMNILNNAIDEVQYQDDKIIDLKLIADSQKITILISDNGLGVDPENADKIFTPFFTTKPVGKGTGLGLSICRGLIEIQKGELNLKSLRPATFEIKLPRK